MNITNLPWVQADSLPWREIEDSYVTEINLSVYSLEAVMKTCYLFLDQCYLFIEPNGEDKVKVYFSSQNSDEDLALIIGEFSNRLLWQETRQRVSDETRAVRELIVDQAFAEAGILNNGVNDPAEADYNSDPLGIAK